MLSSGLLVPDIVWRYNFGCFDVYKEWLIVSKITESVFLGSETQLISEHYILIERCVWSEIFYPFPPMRDCLVGMKNDEVFAGVFLEAEKPSFVSSYYEFSRFWIN